MTRKKAKTDDITPLFEELQRVRNTSLEAARRGDFRSVARLTSEAARLNRLITVADGGKLPLVGLIGGKLFTGESEATVERRGVADQPVCS